MMLRVLPFANAFALVAAAIHTLGALLAVVAPGAYQALWEAWLLLDLAGVTPGGVGFTLMGFLVGLVTATVAGWLIGLALAVVYNAFAGAAETGLTR